MKSSTRAPTWLVELPVLLLGLVVFWSLTFYQIRLPGLHTDEAMEVLPAMQLLRGLPVECYKDVCVEILGLRLPVMIYEYIAATNAYVALPFFALLGTNVTALRTVPIVESTVAMFFLYLLARDLYNRRVAAIAYLLLAVSPSFVFWSRQGIFVTSVTIPISLIALWALLRWWRGAGARYLYLGSFLLGLGISTKLLFWWIVAGAGAAFALLNADRLAAGLRQRSLRPLHIKLRWRDILLAGACGLLGLLPLIIFNIETQSTIRYVWDNVFSTSYYQVDNANVGENLRERIKELGSVINGETFFYLGGKPYASWRYPSTFLFCAGVLAFSVLAPFKSKDPNHPRDLRSTVRQALPAWIAAAAVLIPSYLILRHSRLKDPYWYRWTLALALPAALLSILAFRRRGWCAWLESLLVSLSSSLLFMLFVYMAWKMAKWESTALYNSAFAALLLAPWLRARGEIRRLLFPLLLLAVALVGSCFTPTALFFTHLAILTPWPFLIVAVSADLVARRSGLDRIALSRLPTLAHRRWAAFLSLGLVAIVAVGAMLIHDDLEVDIAYHQDLGRIGGIGDHTSASYDLVSTLQENGWTEVVAMDWGIRDVIQFLSEGQINPPQLSSYESRESEDGAFVIRVKEWLSDPDTVYVFHIGSVFENRWEAFQDIVAQQGAEPVEIKVIHDRAAIPIFRLVRVER
jgi:hypothetical protein